MKITRLEDMVEDERVVAVDPPLSSRVETRWSARLNFYTGRTLTHTALNIEQRHRSGRLAMYGRQLSAGMYSYLPLGYRTLRKVERIVRDEMNAAGAIELHMPVLQPLSIWEETGRTEAMGDVLLRLGGPPGDWRPNTVLGPTHEEVITDIARAFLNSYKQLPINLYQIQTKFRGEARPKSGVLRTREFLMKDAYSFHDNLESLDASYRSMYDTYCRIFGRCGLPYIAVEAESGPIGGDSSHEFMVLTPAGEDSVVQNNCPP